MALSRWRQISLTLCAALLSLVLLAACSNSASEAQPRATPAPSPTPAQGAQLLTKVAHTLNSAKTLHGIFNLTLTGGQMNGTLQNEVWNATPDKSRTVVLQSSISEIPVGSISVTDGKRVWQYDPTKKIVYTGPVRANNNGVGSGGGRSQALITMMQTILTRSDGTLKSSTVTINGRPAYDVAVVPQGSTKGANNFNYEGDIFIDRTTQLPVKLDLNIESLGKVVLDLPKLELNTAAPENTFTFVTPPGVKEALLQQNNSSSGSLSLAQAQQQAGYHLLSIPGNQTSYTLQNINALGAPGNQIYTLNYMKGSISFTLAQGRSLANLPGSGQSTSLRNTTATLSSENGNTTLAWNEKGIGIRITGNLSNDEIIAIAKQLT